MTKTATKTVTTFVRSCSSCLLLSTVIILAVLRADGFRCPSVVARPRLPLLLPRASASTTTSLRMSSNSPMRIYVDYLRRLWDETSTEKRHKVARDKARAAVRLVQQTLPSYDDDVHHASAEVAAVLDSCDKMITIMDNNDDDDENGAVSVLNGERRDMLDVIASTPEDGRITTTTLTTTNEHDQHSLTVVEDDSDAISTTTTTTVAKKKKKPRRSILFGAAMGAVVACWVFSGNYIFTGIFTLMTVLGQLEYYRMVMNAGIYPARRISVTGACAMFVTALFAPSLHQVVLPTFACVAMVWFLTKRTKTTTTISDIATTFTGMFYLGYIPSFWVRTRLIHHDPRVMTRLAPVLKPFLDGLVKQANRVLPPPVSLSVFPLPITTGAVFIFWTWLCIAFSDVAAYFSGRAFGRTKLGAVCPAAGATSPNKTVEGLVGGTVVSAFLGAVGAYAMRWPAWWITGPAHGAILALLGLVGDLTASMLKRDAGLKDFGDLIPEHGGIMDRVDSFVFTAPYSWLMCGTVVPWLRTIC